MSRRNNQNNYNYNGNQYYGNGQNYNGNNQYYNQNGQYNNGQYYNNQNGQYNQNAQYQYNQNNQYYKPNKFGLYDQPQQNNNGKKKIDQALLVKIGMFAGGALILLLIVFCINSCGKSNKSECADDYKLVGEEPFGYVCVPTDWVSFEEDPPNRQFQYSDINGSYIITLDVLSTSQISAKEYALGTANSLEKNQGITVQGAEVKLGKYDAYQVYGQQKESNIWVLLYFFETEDGNTHNIGIEGPDRNNEAFKIPETFIVKK